jgi:hypothetical protein
MSFSGRHIRRKAVGRSRDRGCNGHRILRRVLVDGRHLGLSRAISFHEKVVTATLAASSRGKAMRLERAEAEGDAKALRHPTEEGEATEVSEARSVSWRRGSKTPTLGAHAPETVRQSKEAIWQRVSSGDPPKRSRVS